MTTYGKKCKKDSDCYSKICEMTYKNKQPDTRRCVVSEKSKEYKKSKELLFG